MSEVILLRHAERDVTGGLSKRGMRAAAVMRSVLPHFVSVSSSKSIRTTTTARLLTGREPRIDLRAGYSPMQPAEVEAISAIETERGVSFLDAARQYNDPEILKGIDEKAHELNAMIDELLGGLGEDEKALIVSHNQTIVPAIELRGTSDGIVAPLSGYVIGTSGVIEFHQ